MAVFEHHYCFASRRAWARLPLAEAFPMRRPSRPASFFRASLAAVSARFCWAEPTGDLGEGTGPLFTSFRACFRGRDLAPALFVPFLASVFEGFTGDDAVSTSPPSFSHSANARALSFAGFSGVVAALLRDRFKARPSRPAPRSEALRCHPGPAPGVPIGAKLRGFRFFF